MMARLGSGSIWIFPINPAVQVEVVDGTDEAVIDAMNHITQVCFNWTDEQVAENRPGMVERLRDPKFREKESSFLARLDGQPVAYGRLLLEGGVAYLGGSGVLPEVRGRKVYSTLLRRRLEEARARGYHVAAINAEPYVASHRGEVWVQRISPQLHLRLDARHRCGCDQIAGAAIELEI